MRRRSTQKRQLARRSIPGSRQAPRSALAPPRASGPGPWRSLVYLELGTLAFRLRLSTVRALAPRMPLACAGEVARVLAPNLKHAPATVRTIAFGSGRRTPRDRVGDIAMPVDQAPELPSKASAPEQPNRRCICNESNLHSSAAPCFRRGAGPDRQSSRSPLVAKPSTECLQRSCKHSGRGEARRGGELVVPLDGTSGVLRRPRVAAMPLKQPGPIWSELADPSRAS